MTAPRVVSVAPGSAVARAGLIEGDEIVRVDGLVPRDVIEWQMYTSEADLELDVLRDGLSFEVSVAKDAGDTLGVEVQSALFDRVRTCDNHCEFCFIYQLPKGMRRSLYLKDDDYRLSFLYGNFTTLTRFTEADLERVVTERLSPLHVSIHAIDHDVRNRMLKNERGAMSLRWLRALLDHGIEIRGQVVVCPGVNDGHVLDHTLAGVLERFPELTSVAVVPLGLSRYNTEPAMRLHTADEADRVVDIVERWQETYRSVLGRLMVFAADEYYLMTNRPFPPAESYEGFEMHEDGIGMARTFEMEFNGRSTDAVGPRRGFFAAVDLPANPAAYTGLRSASHSAPAALLPRRSAPVAVLSGPLGARVVGPLIATLQRDDIRVLTVDNEFFGGNTGVTGLMTGEDLIRVLNAEPVGHRYLLPDVCLSDDGRFLDGRSVSDLPRPVEVVPTDGIAPSLRAALEATPMSDFEPTVPTEPTLPNVVIVGRPNVGKSTLFNRIIGEQAAIVENRPGVTRDRKELQAEWLGVPFNIIDTGGWMPRGSDLDDKVSRQVEAAVDNADLVLFIVDASVGSLDLDEGIADWLRRGDRQVLVVANKSDNNRREEDLWQFLSLGLGDAVPVSALHGRRAGDLLDVVLERLGDKAQLPPVPDEDAPWESERDRPAWNTDGPAPPRVAIVGRPNVGKSTLFNRLVGSDRAVVHDMAGTTRDAIDTMVETEDGPIIFVDTAGMRKRSKIDDSAEYYSLVRALRAIDDADIALFIIDATEGVTGQDQRLAERIDASGRPIVVLLNKWELVDDPEQRLDVENRVRLKLAFLGDVPVLKISALTGKGVHRLRPRLQEAVEQYHRRVPTRDVNKVISEAQQQQPAGGGAKVLYAVQGATDPPTFTLFVNRELPQHHVRFLERRIREAFEFGSVPIKIKIRKKTD